MRRRDFLRAAGASFALAMFGVAPRPEQLEGPVKKLTGWENQYASTESFSASGVKKMWELYQKLRGELSSEQFKKDHNIED